MLPFWWWTCSTNQRSVLHTVTTVATIQGHAIQYVIVFIPYLATGQVNKAGKGSAGNKGDLPHSMDTHNHHVVLLTFTLRILCPAFSTWIVFPPILESSP